MKIFKKLSQLLFSLFLLFLFTSLTHAEETYYDGMLDPDFINGQIKGFNRYARINSIVEQDDGKLIIVGDIDIYNGIERNNILRLNPDGSLDTTFDPGTGSTGATLGWGIEVVKLQDDGKIIIGGAFTEYNGVSRAGIARLNSDGSLDTTFTTGSGFSGLIDTWGNAYGVVDIIIQPDGKIVTVGCFSGYNGVARKNIARLNSDGSLDESFDTAEGPGGSYPLIYSAEILSDNKIVIGGEFTTYKGQSANHLARLNTDGSFDNTFSIGTGTNRYVSDIVIKDTGEIFIAGSFTTYNGISRSKLALLNSDGTLNDTFIPSNFGVAYSSWGCESIFLQPDGKLLAGGYFTSYGGVNAEGIVRLNEDATLDTSFSLPNESSSSYVTEIFALDNGQILLGGSIHYYNNLRFSNLIPLNTDGTINHSFNPKMSKGADNSISAIATDNQNRILIGGDFKFFNDSRENNLTRLNYDGSLDNSLDTGTGFNGSVSEIEFLNDGSILVGGSFTEFNGVPRKNLVKLHSNGSLDVSFNSEGSGIEGNYSSVSDIYIQNNGKILITGWRITSYNGTAVGNIARLNSDGSLDTTFNPTSGANSYIENIRELANGKYVITGGFTEFNGVEKNRIAILNSDGSLDTTFNPSNFLPQPELISGGSGDCTFTLNMFDSYGDHWNGGYLTALINGAESGTYSCSGSESSDTIILSNGDTIELTYTSGSYEPENSYEVLINDTKVFVAEAPPDTGSIYTYTCGEDYYSVPPPSGFNDSVYKAIPLPTGEILVGGFFTKYNGHEANRITVLNPDGSINTNFNFGNGFNGTVRDIEFQDDSNFIVSGVFTEYNGESIDKLARLNVDGSLDQNFNIKLGPNLGFNRIKIDNSGKIIIAGSFHKYNNTEAPFITRLLNDLYPPTGSVKINQDEQYTDSREVTLNLTNSDNMSGVSQMMICNNSSFTGCTWESYSSTKTWNLTTENGTKNVYVKFKDAAGNISSVYSDSIIVRTPTIKITSIGQISNIVDKDSLKYYFTSTRPVIKGVTQANSTVTFKYGSKTYTTQADSKGAFEITIENPTLLNGTNNLEYWSTDISGNRSITKTLTLIIGSENFPEWLLEKLGLIMNKVDEEEDSQEEEQVDEEIEEDNIDEQEDTNTPPITNTRKIKFTDKEGRVLAQATVEIEGNTYITDENGEIEIVNLENRTYTAKIKTKDGKEYSMDILGVGDESESMVVEVTEENDGGIDWIKILIYSGIALLVLVVGGVLIGSNKKGNY